jgi:hypothetical protein
MTGAAGASPPRHAALQHAQALAVERVERVERVELASDGRRVCDARPVVHLDDILARIAGD